VSRAGMNVAVEHGKLLTSFLNLHGAQAALFQKRDELIESIVSLAQRTDLFDASFKPGSLKGLEAWYFEMLEDDSFKQVGSGRQKLEQGMAMYIGETIVRNNSEFERTVQEFTFEAGKYEIGCRNFLSA